MDSAAQSVVSNAVQLLGAEYRLLRGVGGQVAKLRDDLESINALLIMQLEAEDGAVDRFVQVCMKQLRELAYDSEDCVDLYKLRISCRPGDGVRARFKHLIRTLFARRRLAEEVSALQARAIDIGDRQARFGVNREALRLARPLLPALLPAPASAVDTGSRRHQLVGIEDQANNLVERLNARVDDDEGALKVFSIVGFGGLGKTTLAMEVCRRLEAEFPHQAMVSVSQAFEPSRDLQALLKRVLQQVVNAKMENEKGFKEVGGLGDIDGLDVKSLAEKLKECLEGRRYLIVIDDVWTTRAWEAIQSMLPENGSDSRIMVTTRIKAVARACSSSSSSKHCICHMKPLKDEDSKKLFLSRVFGSMEDSSCPMDLQLAMENILKKCGGLPLTIVSIASILAGYSKDKWEIVCRSIGSQMENNPTLEGMRQIITLSFHYLPHELKACMMYLSIFPEDYVVDKRRLLQRWIAEGLVTEKRGLTRMEVAESYLDELLSRNMIQEDHFDYEDWYVQCYRVHDMLLEIMVSKSLEANFVSLQGGQYNGIAYNRIRRLSIHGDNLGVDSAPKGKVVGRQVNEDLNVQHVRSLSIFQSHGHKLLKQLGRFTLLRVLDLAGCEGVTNKHVRYACQLYLLRFLSFKDTNISKVPYQIKNLKHLQTFDVRNTLVKGLPETITELEQLEHLEFWYKNDMYTRWKLTRGLNKMKMLRRLGAVSLGNDAQVACELGELELLEKLALFILPETTDEKVLHELASSLSKRHSLKRFTIRDPREGEGKVLNFLHGLPTMPRLLEHLNIDGDMDGLPSWIGSLRYLVHFIMSKTTIVQDELFDVLCKLPNLKSMNVRWKSYSGNEMVAHTNHKFPMLSYLLLGGDLPNVYRFEEGSMANLETIDIDIGYDVVEPITGVEHLSSLKKIILWGRKDNNALNHALEQLKTQSDMRPKSNQFQVVVKYDMRIIYA